MNLPLQCDRVQAKKQQGVCRKHCGQRGCSVSNATGLTGNTWPAARVCWRGGVLFVVFREQAGQAAFIAFDLAALSNRS